MEQKAKSGAKPQGEQGGRLCKHHPNGAKYLPIELFTPTTGGKGNRFYRDKCSECYNAYLRERTKRRKEQKSLNSWLRLNKLWGLNK